MIAAIYTNQSTHIWEHGVAPEQQDTGGYAYVWKRPIETFRYVCVIHVVVTIAPRIVMYRAKPGEPIPIVRHDHGLERLKREVFREAEEVLWKEAQRVAHQQAAEEAERRRVQRLHEQEDDEIVFAASILFRKKKPTQWTVY